MTDRKQLGHDRDLVADLHRAVEHDPVHRHRGAAPARPPGRDVASGTALSSCPIRRSWSAVTSASWLPASMSPSCLGLAEVTLPLASYGRAGGRSCAASGLALPRQAGKI
jgi:hypothetical protein